MPNVLVLGSSVIDLFVTISTSHVAIHGTKLEMNLGDKIPADIKSFALGGNGANIAVGLTKLEIPTTFYTYLGKDIFSRYIEEQLTKEGVELVAERAVSDNTPLHIIFDFATDRIIFSHYPQANHGFNAEKVAKPDFLYINSLAEIWEDAYAKALAYAKENTIQIAFSPGSRQLDQMSDIVYEVLKSTTVFFANKDEVQRILNSKNLLTSSQDLATASSLKYQISNLEIKDTLRKMKELGPQVVSMTDGGKGAYVIDAQDHMYHISSFEPDLQGTDKTGAGDAYASGFFAAYLLGKETATCMRWGAANANGTMQEVGAQGGLLTTQKMEAVLSSRQDFQAEELL